MSFPDVSDALWDLTEPTTLRVVVQTVTDFEGVEVQQAPETFDASLQPLKAQQLLVKSEGERRWRWFTIVTEKVLKLDDVIQDDEGNKYRVRSAQNWKQAGFYRYEATEGPTPGETNPT